MTSGEALRDQGQSDTLAAATVPHHDHTTVLAHHLDLAIGTGHPFTAETVRAHLPADTKAWLKNHGSVLAALIGGRAGAKRIRAVGWVTPTRAKRRHNPIRVWEANR